MKIPRSTYRLQFTPEFNFQDAKKMIPYLSRLGIHAIYSSPIFQARSQSQHGYDVVDSNRINDELGGEEAFYKLHNVVKKHNMLWIQDIVPNHMAFDTRNKSLMDVLEKGRLSKSAKNFDIDWHHYDPGFKGKILTPFLGKFYPDAIDDGDIKLLYDEDGFRIAYYQLQLPMYMPTYEDVLSRNMEVLPSAHKKRLKSWLTLLQSVFKEKNHKKIAEQVAALKQSLWAMSLSYPQIRSHIMKSVEFINGRKGHPESFDSLDHLLSKQVFRLSFWKTATEQVNYRRFFSINELISLNIGNAHVFEHTHALILRFLKEGYFDGLRIDHIDGLYDPTSYLRKLRRLAPEAYIIVEKILEKDEMLPLQWPVEGETGYQFMGYINSLFCDQSNKSKFDKIYRNFSRMPEQFEDLVHQKKRLILGKHMAGDIDNLAHLFKKVSDRLRYGHDVTFYGLKRALVEIMVYFPVYRTYIDKKNLTVMDRMYIQQAIEQARISLPSMTFEINYIEKFLLLEFESHFSMADKKAWFHFVMRFQQFTGPVMAKGFEDTALYIYNRNLALNEVGSNPVVFGLDKKVFYKYINNRSEKWPYSLNASSTHDTKRAEDVRARLNVLSEMPERWEQFLKNAKKMNAKYKTTSHHHQIPTPNDEYFLYQTLIGTFVRAEGLTDQYRKRIKDYIIKSVREAKVHTAWLKPDDEYEQAFMNFIEDILTDKKVGFIKLLDEITAETDLYGYLNSLSQVLIKMTAGGIPDFYQGSELWQFHLVDPDNRQLVDYSHRSASLKDLEDQEKQDAFALHKKMMKSLQNGNIKLYLITKVLKLINQDSAVFQKGQFNSVEVQGQHARSIVAYTRSFESLDYLFLVPRLVNRMNLGNMLPLGNVWGDTKVTLPKELSNQSWREVFTDQSVKFESKILIKDTIKTLPFAAFVREG